MVSLDGLVNLAFTPKFMATANFTAFGAILGLGVWQADILIEMGSLGFFIAGACIGALWLMDGWVHGNQQPIQKPMPEMPKINKVLNYGVPKNNIQIQTAVEL